MKLSVSTARARFALLTLLAGTTVLMATAYTYRVERRRAREQTHDENLRLTRLVASRQAGLLDGAQRLLLTLANMPAVNAKDPRVCGGLLQQMLGEHPEFVNVTVAEADGSVFCAGAPRAGSDSPGGRSAFERAAKTGRMSLGEYHLDATNNMPSIVVAHPILAPSGEARRVIAVTLALERFTQIATQVAVPEGATLTLFDRGGTILARHPDGQLWVGKHVAADWRLPEVSEKKSPTAEALGVDGMRRFYVTVPVEAQVGEGLYVEMGVEPAVAFSSANRILRELAGLLGLALLAAIAVAAVGGNFFVRRPARTLTDVTRQLAEGDLTARARLADGVPGLMALAAALNNMAASLVARERVRDAHDAERRASDIRDRQLAMIVEHSEDAILSADLEGVIKSWNGGAERLLGWSASEAIGQSLSFIVPDDRSEEPLTELRRLAAGERLTRRETVLRRKNGGTVDVSWTLSPVMDGNGLTIGASAIWRDISSRVMADRPLKEASERVRYAVEAAQLGVWDVDLESGLVRWSALLESHHGLPAGTFGGTFDAFIQCVHPDDRQEVVSTIKRTSRGPFDPNFLYRTIWPDGSNHWIRCIGRFVCDEAGTPVRGSGVAMDVTERHTLEEQFIQASKMEAIGDLAGGIAHDFNNTLTAILGNAEFLADGLSLQDGHREDVEEIRLAAERAADLTHKLLAFGRKQMLVPRVLQIGDVIGEITPMLRRLIGETTELRMITTDLGRVRADRSQLEQMLVTFVVNARDAMPNGGCLTIESTDVWLGEDYVSRHPSFHPAAYVMVAVTDTGYGMDAQTRSRIFEPFFTTKPEGEGKGLSLATVYGIVKQSGGHMWVYSEVGRGTTFKVYLPCTSQPAESPPPVESAAAPPRGTETILVVEDEDAIGELVRKALTRQGYAVHNVSTPGQALEFAETHKAPVDLLLSDVVLPDMSGPMLAEQFLLLHPESRLLFMSGYTEHAMVHQGVIEPGRAFLPKPFSPVALIRKVREVLETASVSAE